MTTKNILKSFKSKAKIISFPFILFGYGLIALLVNDANTSQMITIPYRIIVLVLSMLMIIFFDIRKLINYHVLISSTKIALFPLLIFIFIIIYSLRVVYETSYNDSLVKENSEYLLFWYCICLLPGLTFLFIDSKYSKKYLYCSWLFLSIISIFTLLSTDRLTNQAFTENGRLSADALNPITLGHYSVSLVLISLYSLLSRKEFIPKNSKIIRGLFLIMMLIGLYISFLAASRGPIIALLICCFLLFISMQREGVKSLKIIIILIFISIFANILISQALDTGSSVINRFLETDNEFGYSRKIEYAQRPELFAQTIEMVIDNPLLGYGLELPNFGYPHNIILEAFLTTGIFGGLIFIIIFSYVGIKAIGIIMNKKSSWNWLGLLYIQYAISVMFSGSLYNSNIFWYLFFTILSINNFKKNNYQVYFN